MASLPLGHCGPDQLIYSPVVSLLQNQAVLNKYGVMPNHRS